MKKQPDGFVDRLFEALSELADEDGEFRKEIISESGVDISSLQSEVMRRLKRLKLQELREKSVTLGSKAAELRASLLSRYAGKTDREVLEGLKEILGISEGNAAFAAFSRKFESLGRDDLNKIVTEAEILNILAEELKSKGKE